MFIENKNKNKNDLVSILISFQGSITPHKNMPLLKP